MNRSGIRAALAAATIAAQLALPLAQAADAAGARVEAVQMPAWVERDGGNVPLAPGMDLRGNDRVRTGAGSRLLLRMPEGSAVKLGENASLVLESLHMDEKARVLAGTMKVLEGAFRFTTELFRKAGGARRDINIMVATLTTGVRGTDVWGKAASDRDIVCLIEGRIEVQRGSEAPIVMDQPLSFYIAPHGRPALPVAPVDAKQLAQWAAETEIQPGKGAARRGGKWKVVLGAAETQADALKLYDDVRAAGYAAQIHPVERGEKTIYNLRLGNLPSRAEAQALADSLRGKMGLTEPRVSR